MWFYGSILLWTQCDCNFNNGTRYASQPPIQEILLFLVCISSVIVLTRRVTDWSTTVKKIKKCFYRLHITSKPFSFDKEICNNNKFLYISATGSPGSLLARSNILITHCRNGKMETFWYYFYEVSTSEAGTENRNKMETIDVFT